MRPTFPSTEEDREFGRWQSEVERRLGELESSGPLRNASITDGALRVLDASKDPRVVAGKLDDGSYDLAAVDPSSKTGRLEALALGISADTVPDAEVPNHSSSYGDMSTVGPTVTVDVGETGRLLVFIYASLGMPNGDPFMSFQISGASSVSPSDDRSIQPLNLTWAGGGQFLVTGLNSGSHTVRAKYRRDDSFAEGSVSSRHLIARAF